MPVFEESSDYRYVKHGQYGKLKLSKEEIHYVKNQYHEVQVKRLHEVIEAWLLTPPKPGMQHWMMHIENEVDKHLHPPCILIYCHNPEYFCRIQFNVDEYLLDIHRNVFKEDGNPKSKVKKVKFVSGGYCAWTIEQVIVQSWHLCRRCEYEMGIKQLPDKSE